MEVPLLKTCWLSQKPGEAGAADDGGAGGRERGGVRDRAGFSDGAGGPAASASAAWGERGGRLGAGTMSRSGARCPGCGAMATMGDLRATGKGGPARGAADGGGGGRAAGEGVPAADGSRARSRPGRRAGTRRRSTPGFPSACRRNRRRAKTRSGCGFPATGSTAGASCSPTGNCWRSAPSLRRFAGSPRSSPSIRRRGAKR